MTQTSARAISRKKPSTSVPASPSSSPAAAKPPSFKGDFENHKFPPSVNSSDAFGIYALSIFVDEPDLDALTAAALTAGNDDKKADFIYIELEKASAYIGQSYLSPQWGKAAAKANKAAALGTAITWLVQAPIAKVPANLKQHAADLRKAMGDGSVQKVYLLYTHNCHESKNVRSELEVAAKTARAHCGSKVTVATQELGLETLGQMFDAIDKDIMVTDKVTFRMADGHYETTGPHWSAIATRVPGDTFHDLFAKHHDALFSANIRNYLGSLKQKRGNINADIRQTVMTQPKNFWVFNNGITVLTNGYTVDGDSLIVDGVSVINGAQTTGVLGECPRSAAATAMVPCRFVKCEDADTIENIIAFNNTQNAVKSFDLRSNDRVQKALETAFAQSGITYVHRRSQSRRAPANSIHVESVAQGLASFHGKLQVAIRQRASIFDDDKVYEGVFPKHISAAHVYLVQCLLDAIDSLKLQYRAKQASGTLTGLQSEYLTLLEFSTAKQFVVFVLGYVVDQILESEVADLHKWAVLPTVLNPDRTSVVSAWKDVLVAVVPKISRSVRTDPQTAVRSTDDAERTGNELADYLEAQGDELGAKLKAIRRLTTTT